MLVYIFRPRAKSLAIRKLKDLKNKHLCMLWQATEKDVKRTEVLENASGRE